MNYYEPQLKVIMDNSRLTMKFTPPAEKVAGEAKQGTMLSERLAIQQKSHLAHVSRWLL